ncbi:hypothetical protein RUM43_005723 [Polyplax serrata]|uniref:Glycolipid transfer protein domain-containing protein n=1 Tax=Polyplax serrata TaxID=468196 RepID=A0AAN8PJW2_POLSC
MGNVFSPLHNDIARNIEKVKESYDANPSLYECIEDLILNKKSEGDEIPLEALLWLKRALHFSLLFFQRIINDNRKCENLQEHMAFAYSHTLEPYHNWITRKLFKFFKNLSPKRSDLFSKIRDGSDEDDERVLHFLDVYFGSLIDSIDHISSLLLHHNLDSKVKV